MLRFVELQKLLPRTKKQIVAIDSSLGDKQQQLQLVSPTEALSTPNGTPVRQSNSDRSSSSSSSSRFASPPKSDNKTLSSCGSGRELYTATSSSINNSSDTSYVFSPVSSSEDDHVDPNAGLEEIRRALSYQDIDDNNTNVNSINMGGSPPNSNSHQKRAALMESYIKGDDPLRSPGSPWFNMKLQHNFSPANQLQKLGQYVIGQEKDNVFLIARDELREDKTMCTVIEMRDLRRGETRILYRHECKAKFMCASLNTERTVLAYTICKKRRSDSSQSGVFESYLVEIEHGAKFSFNLNGLQFPRIQFIHSDNSRKNCSSFLCFWDKLGIELYDLYTEARKTRDGKKVHMIKNQPELQATFVKQYIWFEWDPQHSLLYYLVYKSKTPTPGANTSDYFLRCCTFTGRRPEIIWEILLPMRMPDEVLAEGCVEYELYPWRNGHSSPDSSIYLHVVKMSENAVCLCQQHINTTLNSVMDIGITIYVLHHRTKIEFSVPMNITDPTTIRQTRVFFGCIGDILVVFLPGCFLQLFDCGSMHEPRELISFTGPEQAPFLPQHSGARNVDLVVPLSYSCKEGEYTGNIMLNLRTGIVYRCGFERNQIIKWIEGQTKLKMYIPTLHMSIVHLRDSYLVEQIFKVLCTKQVSNFSHEIITEVLLGNIHNQCKVIIGDEEFLRYLPASNLSHQKSPFRSNAYSFSTIFGPFIVYHQKAMPPSRAMPRFTLIDRVRSPSSPTTNGQAQTNANFIAKSKKFFGFFYNKKAPNSDSSNYDLDSYPQLARRMFEEAVEESLNAIFSKKESKKTKLNLIPKWAQDFTRVVCFACEDVFKMIRECEPNNDKSEALFSEVVLTKKNYFHLLEHFHCALEELSFPPPPGFIEHFATIGFQVLPRSLFLQYLYRDVFRLTSALASELLDAMGDSKNDTPEDAAFRYQLLSRLKDRRKELRLLEKNEDNYNVLLDYYHGLIHQANLSTMMYPFDDSEILDRFISEIEHEQSGAGGGGSAGVTGNHANHHQNNNNSSRANNNIRTPQQQQYSEDMRQFAPLAYFLVSLNLTDYDPLTGKRRINQLHEKRFIRENAARVLRLEGLPFLSPLAPPASTSTAPAPAPAYSSSSTTSPRSSST